MLDPWKHFVGGVVFCRVCDALQKDGHQPECPYAVVETLVAALRVVRQRLQKVDSHMPGLRDQRIPYMGDVDVAIGDSLADIDAALEANTRPAQHDAPGT